MSAKDTGMGGPQRQFPSTMWSDILEAADPNSPQNRAQLERLLKQYWKPVFAHIRLSWNKSVEDSKDLTQAFFSHVLENGFLAHVKPEKGTFRSYLKRSVRNFLIDTERAAAHRRPSGPMFSIEAGPAELERLGATSSSESPDKVYDREWFNSLFEAGIREMKDILERDDKAVYFQVFQSYCLDPETGGLAAKVAPTYREIAVRFNLKDSDVRNYLTYCRRALQTILRARIREYAASDDEVEQELELALRI